MAERRRPVLVCRRKLETLPRRERKAGQEFAHRQTFAAGFLQLRETQRAFAAGHEHAFGRNADERLVTSAECAGARIPDAPLPRLCGGPT